MLLRCIHETRYRYRTPAFDSHNELRLQPLTDDSQSCVSFTLETDPSCAIFSHREIGGPVHFFNLRAGHKHLTITATSEVRTVSRDPFRGLNLLEDDWDFYRSPLCRQLYAEFLSPSAYAIAHPRATQIAEAAKGRCAGSSVATTLLELCQSIHGEFAYDPDVTHVHSTVAEVLELKAGVCQDFAHLMISCCRAIGVPARYVSGYLYSGPIPMRGDEAMHAWLECPMPDGRWLAIDPTNNILATDQYIRVHLGRDYGDVTPTRGLYMGTPAESMEVTLSVEPIEAEAHSA